MKQGSLFTAGRELQKAFANSPDTVSARPAVKTESKDMEDPGTQTVTVTAVGDCTLGRNHKMGSAGSWNAVFKTKGPEHFLQHVAPVFKSSDLAIANLEGVLTDSPLRKETFYRQKSNIVQEKLYCHLGAPEYIKALTCGGINAVSFANNHNIDYGLSGFADTLDACRSVDLPVAYYDTVVRRKIGDITVGIVSADFSYLDRRIGTGFLRKAMADVRRDCGLIVVCIHWGLNYKENPGPEQKRLGRLCVDLGADLVLGSHAHILQGVERYKGRYIFYSLGNFCYGGRKVPKDNDTVIVRQTFTFSDGKLCVDDNVEMIPCWICQEETKNDFSPVIKSGEEAAKIIEKINDRSAAFGVRFDSAGRPAIRPERNTEINPPDEPYYESVPSIIYTLVDSSD